ncbi:MAG: C10 family peptidase [Thermodesulfobacteriota bacterium]
MDKRVDGISRKPRLLITGWALGLLLFWVGMGAQAWARPTTPSQARGVVKTWLSLDPRPLGVALGDQVAEVLAFPGDAAEPHYFVVYLDPGGFVVVPGDDLVEPIIAFIPRGRYDPSLDTPLGALVSQDLAGRVAAAREMERLAREELLAPESAYDKARRKWQLLAQPADAAKSLTEAAGLADISDIRVAPFVLSKWGQGSEGTYCYNYYTPNHYVCGCVATFMAQLMRYHLHPTAGVGTPTFNIYVDGALVSNVPLRGGNGSGGAYQWGNMVLDPDASTTDAQRQAIGALTYDAGVSVNMSYRSDGSAATFSAAMNSLRNTFGYSNAMRGYNSGTTIPLDKLYPMINPNMDARLPVAFDIRRPGGGHGVLADGYGYNLGTMYHHINLGWSGSKDAWYNLPDISIPEWGYNYNTILRCGYNIYPSGAGEIISGRVTNTGGKPVNGAAVLATRSGGGSYAATTDSRGIYALAKVLSASSYTIVVSKKHYTFSPRSVSTGTSQDDTLTMGNVWGVDFIGTGGPKGPIAPLLLLMN